MSDLINKQASQVVRAREALRQCKAERAVLSSTIDTLENRIAGLNNDIMQASERLLELAKILRLQAKGK